MKIETYFSRLLIDTQVAVVIANIELATATASSTVSAVSTVSSSRHLVHAARRSL